jgi:excisionase family DNA binding protein
MAERLLSVSECAARHKVARTTIHQAIRRGALAAIKVGSIYVITEQACEAYQPVREPRAKGTRGAAVRWGSKVGTGGE